MLIRQLVDPVSLFEEAHRVAAYGGKPQCLLLPCLEHDIQTTVVHWPILVGFYPMSANNHSSGLIEDNEFDAFLVACHY